MGDSARHLHRRMAAVWRWFFPLRIAVPLRVTRRLAYLYPALDLEHVRFFDGMPHVLHWIDNAAITLPASHRTRGVNVYIARGYWDTHSVKGFGLAVHEAFHALQIRDSWNGWGLGLLRPFIVLYLACAAKNRFRYKGHPMENDAYCLAGNRESLFEKGVHASILGVAGDHAHHHDHDEAAGGSGADDLDAFHECCGGMVHHSSGLDFWRKLAESTLFTAGLRTAFGRCLRSLSSTRAKLRAGGSLPRALPRMIPLSLAIGSLALVLAAMIGVWLSIWVAATAVLWLASLSLQLLGVAFCGPLVLFSRLLAPADGRESPG